MMQCLFASCVNGCIGHAATYQPSHITYTTHVYSGPTHMGAMLTLIAQRPSHKPYTHHTTTNPYKGMCKALRDNFRFKGMASRQFI